MTLPYRQDSATPWVAVPSWAVADSPSARIAAGHKAAVADTVVGHKAVVADIVAAGHIALGHTAAAAVYIVLAVGMPYMLPGWSEPELVVLL